MNDIVFLAPTSVLSQPKRMAKIALALLEEGSSVTFYGWEREPGEIKEKRWPDGRVTEYAILRGGGYGGKKVRLMYALWMLAVFLRSLFLGRNRTIVCMGWETAFPAMIASIFTGSKIVFDDPDRFSMIVKLPDPFHNWVQRAERWTSSKSLIHIIPGVSRYSWRSENMIVVRNTPSNADLNEARSFPVEKYNSDLIVYINGWVGQTRGASIFLQAFMKMREAKLKFRVLFAGRTDTSDGDALCAMEEVVNYGVISTVQSLKLYREADVVLTYYDPDIEINKHAESNKWGDCVFFGVPFIVNSEVLTAAHFVDQKAAWALPYKDPDALASLLAELVSAPEELRARAKAISALSPQYPMFDDQISLVVKIIRNRTAIDSLV